MPVLQSWLSHPESPVAHLPRSGSPPRHQRHPYRSCPGHRAGIRAQVGRRRHYGCRQGCRGCSPKRCFRYPRRTRWDPVLEPRTPCRLLQSPLRRHCYCCARPLRTPFESECCGRGVLRDRHRFGTAGQSLQCCPPRQHPGPNSTDSGWTSPGATATLPDRTDPQRCTRRPGPRPWHRVRAWGPRPEVENWTRGWDVPKSASSRNRRQCHPERWYWPSKSRMRTRTAQCALRATPEDWR